MADNFSPGLGAVHIERTTEFAAGHAAHVIGRGAGTIRVSASLTRPADTTTYAAGDAWGTAATVLFTFAGAALSDRGSGIVQAAKLTIARGTPILTNGSFNVWLFSASPASPPAADNAAYLISAANAALRIGPIPLSLAKLGSDCAESLTSPNLGLAFNLPTVPASSPATYATTLYGLLELTAAYVPTASEIATIHLDILQD